MAIDPDLTDLLIECRTLLFAARASEPPALTAEFHERAEAVTERITAIVAIGGQPRS